MTIFNKNVVASAFQRLSTQGGSARQNLGYEPPPEGPPINIAGNASPCKIQDHQQAQQQAKRERSKFFKQFARSKSMPEPAGASPALQPTRANSAPAGQLQYDGPSARITGTAGDAKLRELNRRLDSLNGHPTENGKPVSLKQRQASLEQRLERLDSQTTNSKT